MEYLFIQNLKKTWQSSTKKFSVDFSLRVEEGTMVALLGHSGSGKSTVLKLIAGLIPPDKCEETKVFLNDKNIINLPARKRGIGFVSQSPALFGHMRVDDNVAYGLRCRGLSKKESRYRAESLLERFSLSGFASRYPDSLSGGEAQRVSLARTLIVEPKLILFDEPLSALDKKLRQQLALDICKMQKDWNFTGIFVTHDENEAKIVASKTIHMKDGKIIH